jgi:putative ABC transport system permease protein
MFKSYLKTAWRNILHNKTTSLISTAGLAVGIGCFLLLATYILNELSYDRFNTKADRIVRLIEHRKSSTGAEVIDAITPTAPVPVLKQAIPGIEEGSRVYNYSSYAPAAVQYKDQLFNERRFLMADAPFFKIFSFKFLEGNPGSALSQVNSVVITSSIAKKYFGDEDPIGKILKVNNKLGLIVTGVIANVPESSHIKFDLLGNYAMLDRSKTRKWDSSNDYSYFLLQPGVNAKVVQQQINTYTSGLINEAGSKNKGWFELEPLLRMHLYSQASGNLETGGNIKYVYILSVVAIILLLLACVNFLNLVTAKSIDRAHEIGVRKVMGALRGQLFVQFISEAGIITLISLVVGIVLAALTFPWFSKFSGHELNFQSWDAVMLVPGLVGVFVLVTFLAGTYPSLYLAAFKPVATLKGKMGEKSGGKNMRKSLVVFQFAVSVFFIISTVVAGMQLHFIQSTDTGINRSQVVVLDVGGIPFNSIKTFGNTLMQHTGVKNFTASYSSPVSVGGGYTIDQAEGIQGKVDEMVTAIPVERNFINTLGIKLVAGINFTPGDEERALDTTANKKISFILNESAVKALGWKPEEAIGKHIDMNGRAGEIRGVAKDFNFESLRTGISPIVIFTEYDYFGKMLIKTTGNDMAGTMDMIKANWHNFYPNKPFEPHFLNQEYEDMYQTEQHTSGLLVAFTLVTIFISCLGLFGLAIFSTKQRVREVGIRKVLGATVPNIVGLISWDFLKLVLISVCIASPLGYYVMSKWLQDFVYRINIHWWVFALSALLAVAIAFLTVAYQSFKAAAANPVKSLRSE